VHGFHKAAGDRESESRARAHLIALFHAIELVEDLLPPDSRMTGADSPVIAASLTEAMPSITSPSDGMVSPASTSTTSPTLRLVLGDQFVSAAAGCHQQLGLRLGSLAPQRRRLRFAAALGDCLGEVGE
jgi:hypothetical protein